jgi:hypothetical protein
MRTTTLTTTTTTTLTTTLTSEVLGSPSEGTTKSPPPAMPFATEPFSPSAYASDRTPFLGSHAPQRLRAHPLMREESQNF